VGGAVGGWWQCLSRRCREAVSVLASESESESASTAESLRAEGVVRRVVVLKRSGRGPRGSQWGLPAGRDGSQTMSKTRHEPGSASDSRRTAPYDLSVLTRCGTQCGQGETSHGPKGLKSDSQTPHGRSLEESRRSHSRSWDEQTVTQAITQPVWSWEEQTVRGGNRKQANGVRSQTLSTVNQDT
jgi:hypothetical protein